MATALGRDREALGQPWPHLPHPRGVSAGVAPVSLRLVTHAVSSLCWMTGSECQRIPVRRRLGDRVRRDDGAGIGMVFKRHRLSEFGAKPVGQQTGTNVGSATHRTRSDDLARVFVIRLVRARSWRSASWTWRCRVQVCRATKSGSGWRPCRAWADGDVGYENGSVKRDRLRVHASAPMSRRTRRALLTRNSGFVRQMFRAPFIH